MTTFSSWRKSSRSGSQANCVEVGMAPGLVGIRDTKDRSGGTILVATPAAWNTFLRGIRAGEFDAS